MAFHGDQRWDIHWIRKVELESTGTANPIERTVLLMCNHCEDPPCAQVCPVQATYKREDGIVVVDHHRCIGCRYCMIACPYNARFFNYKENPEWPNKEFPKRSHGVAESCTFCAHRIIKKKKPACVSACPTRSLTIGDLNDPDSEVSRQLKSRKYKVLKPEAGTDPRVFFLY